MNEHDSERIAGLLEADGIIAEAGPATDGYGIWVRFRGGVLGALNLLANSIRFTLPGGTITVMSRVDEEGRLACSVSDTGQGIAPENLDIVMTPFGQADGSLARPHDGVGLGLPLSRSLAELHGGSLTLESTSGVGTTVTVTFPTERVIHAAAE